MENGAFTLDKGQARRTGRKGRKRRDKRTTFDNRQPSRINR